MREHRWRQEVRWNWVAACVLASAIVLTLTGCSTSGSSGGTNFTLGLSGSTADHPSQPPQVAPNGPSGTFAFVYDNQIWLRQNGHAAKQLTHLALSNGASIGWGPLVWSPGGKYIAFALVENLSPNVPMRGAGPIYFVDTSSGSTSVTGGTGSIYGHTYAWYDDNVLFYSTGGGIMMYDLGDPDPRVWTALSVFPATDVGFPSVADSAGISFGDISIASNRLFYTKLVVTSPGATGTIGSAQVKSISLASVAGYQNVSPSYIPAFWSQALPLDNNAAPALLASLGQVYTDPVGNYVTGAWQVAANGRWLVTQQIKTVDTKAGVATSGFCARASYYGYYNCISVLAAASSQHLAIHPQISLSPDGSHVALAADALYIENTNGNGAAKLALTVQVAPQAWARNNSAVAATQIVSQTTNANGAVREQTDVLAYGGGSAPPPLIAGARDLAWQPPN